MGEYAKIGGQSIKIGTCENMYYLRFEDRMKVTKEENSLDPATCLDLHWRLPIPSEDDMEIGCYDSCFQYRDEYKNWAYDVRLNGDIPEEDKELFTNHFGTITLNTEAGFRALIKCYHGAKMPEGSADIIIVPSHRRASFHMKSVKNTSTELRIEFCCDQCGETFSSEFTELEHMIVSPEMKQRLFKMCTEYYEQMNKEVAPYWITRKEGEKVIKLERCRRGDVLGYEITNGDAKWFEASYEKALLIF